MSKYHSRKVTMDGITFDSVRECKRYSELKLLEKAGEIYGLRLQDKFNLLPFQKPENGRSERAVTYIADFVYFDKTGKMVVEDTKGFKTKDYILKRKMMLYFHGISIKEI